MSLFKDGMMRKPDKAILRSHLLVKEASQELCVMKVVDGGSLLHHVHWPENVTFRELMNHHTVAVRSKYGTYNIVFDGYSIPPTKDHEHARRSDKEFSEEIKLAVTRDVFLSNNNNKSLVIAKLAAYLRPE